MKLTEFFLEQLEQEARKSRAVLERVPEGRNDWKPHEKSMPLGYLAALVAAMPSWVRLMIETDEFDYGQGSLSQYHPRVVTTTRELLEQLDAALAQGREALQKTTEDHLLKPWRALVNGRVVSEDSRQNVLRDAVYAHMAHHRGQLTVYLRLTGALVPALYGPSADERV